MLTWLSIYPCRARGCHSLSLSHNSILSFTQRWRAEGNGPFSLECIQHNLIISRCIVTVVSRRHTSFLIRRGQAGSFVSFFLSFCYSLNDTGSWQYSNLKYFFILHSFLWFILPSLFFSSLFTFSAANATRKSLLNSTSSVLPQHNVRCWYYAFRISYFHIPAYIANLLQ